MSKDITILTSANHTFLVKTFSGSDKAEQPFAIGEDFKVTKEPVSDLSSLAELLHRLESKPTQTIISESSVVNSQVDLDGLNRRRSTGQPESHAFIFF